MSIFLPEMDVLFVAAIKREHDPITLGHNLGHRRQWLPRVCNLEQQNALHTIRGPEVDALLAHILHPGPVNCDESSSSL